VPLEDALDRVATDLVAEVRDDDRRRTREAGFDHHLVKPVASDELHAVLRTIRA
jgi:DNA-binding response OmpR family regulator